MAQASTAEQVRDGEQNSIFWFGLASTIAFYFLILLIGILVSYLRKVWKGGSQDMIVGNRDIGLLVGILTMTASWVGGVYINGTAEIISTPGLGLVWSQTPVAFSIGFVVAGLFYVPKMHEHLYTTILDPFHVKYGPIMTGLLYLPQLACDVCYAAAVLYILGSTLKVVVGLEETYGVFLSGGVSVLYILFGGMYSVAFTDVIQMACMFAGLWMVVPFAMTHEAVASMTDTATTGLENNTGWLGSLDWKSPVTGLWLDSGLVLTLAIIPCMQVYYQRVFSQRTARRAQALSFAASVGCLILAIPPTLLGAVYFSTDWNETDYRGPTNHYALALPLVVRYLTPTPVAVIGLGSVSAAVMSSVDSTILASASLFAKNFYQPLRTYVGSLLHWNQATDGEVVHVMRAAILMIGATACAVATTAHSIFPVFFLSTDLVYVTFFPQITCILYVTFANKYGSAAGFVLGLFFRLAGGEAFLSLPPLIKYPWFEEATQTQYFPFKTFAVAMSFLGIIVGSWISQGVSDKKTRCVKGDRVLSLVEGRSGKQQEAPPHLQKEQLRKLMEDTQDPQPSL